MIVIHQVPGAWGLPSVSPFCTKLQAYCRLAGLEHEVKDADVLRSPKGKVPYVSIDGGPFLGDSQLVIEALVAKYGDRLDAKLSPAEKATGHLVRRTLEEGTYFTSLYFRWVDDAGWAVTSQAYTFIPWFAKPLVRRAVKQTALKQGVGRHTAAEIDAMAVADWTAIASTLGDRPFLLGDEPTSFDATLYAFVSAALAFPLETAHGKHVTSLPNLVAYRDRAQKRIFG